MRGSGGSGCGGGSGDGCGDGSGWELLQDKAVCARSTVTKKEAYLWSVSVVIGGFGV